MNIFGFKKSLLLILCSLILLTSCEIRIGTDSFGVASFYPTAKQAFEEEAGYNAIQGAWEEIREDIGVFEVDNTYSLYFAILDYTRNGSVSDTVISVMLMETKNGKYRYTGSCSSFSTNVLNATESDEEKIAKSSFPVNDKEIEYHFAKKDLLNKADLTENFNFHECVINFNGQSTEITIAVSK